MKNLQAEMKRFGVSVSEIQRILGCTEKTARNKISGASEFSIQEAIAIRNILFPGLRLEYLYQRDVEENKDAS